MTAFRFVLIHLCVRIFCEVVKHETLCFLAKQLNFSYMGRIRSGVSTQKRRASSFGAFEQILSPLG